MVALESRLRRIALSVVVMLFVVPLDTRLAWAQADCPPAHAPSLSFDASSPSAPPITALQTSVWRTVTVGNYTNANEIRDAFKSAPCHMEIGDDANEVMGRPTFPFVRTQAALDLVAVPVTALGFADQPSLKDVYARAVERGFELCPAEAGPALRLSYLNQPVGEFLRLAMQPISRYGGEPVVFSVGNGGAGLLLVGMNGRPNLSLPLIALLLFVRPRAVTSPNTLGKR
jgi:hypothetical protein